MRDAVGDRVAVGLRLAGDDEQTYGPGLTADDAAEVAARYEELGLVDYLNVSVGVGGVGMVRTNYTPHGFGGYAAHAVKKAVRDTPVFTVHRILNPEEAEGILERHEADGITLVRALIADAEWVNKARDGRADEIRQCTGINQSCYGNLLQSMPINCVQNPVVGREDELGLGTLHPAPRAKRVVVVGGGPAGLEAAWVAAARGHRVTLLEAADELGGAIRWAQRLPGRAEIAHLADWRVGECERRGVELRTGVRASAASVLALEPDAVIVATGGHATKDGRSAYHPMPVPGAEQDWVLDTVEALRRAEEEPDRLGARVVVLEAVGHVQGVGLGELLARQGRQTTVVSTLPVLLACDGETQAAILPRAVQAGMVWRPSTALGAIGDHEVTLIDVLSHRAETQPADTVVIVTNGVPDASLHRALRTGGWRSWPGSVTRCRCVPSTVRCTTVTGRAGRCSPGQTWAPPATVMACPLTKLAASLARNTATAAVSSGVCMRPRGMVARTQSSRPRRATPRSSPGLPPPAAGDTPSGQMALARIWCGASSVARTSVRRSTPARAAENAPKPASPATPADEERLTMAPPRPASTIGRAHARAPSHTAVRLASRVACHEAGSRVSREPFPSSGPVPPDRLQQTSIRPNASSVAATESSTASGSVSSTGRVNARRPSAATAAAVASRASRLTR